MIPANFIQQVPNEIPLIIDTGTVPEGFHKVSIGDDILGWEHLTYWENMEKLNENRVVAINIGKEIASCDNIDGLMTISYSRLTHMGMMFITAPYWTSSDWANDPRNINRINEYMFGYYSNEWRKSRNMEQTNINFELVGLKWTFYPEWENRSDEAKKWAKEHYLNVIQSLHFVLRAIKA